MTSTPTPVILDVGIRLAGPDDMPAVRRLAALDSLQPPSSPVLLAQVGGVPRAALGLVDRRVVADPFSPTADIVALLRLRADRLQAPASSARRRTRLLPGLRRRQPPLRAW